MSRITNYKRIPFDAILFYNTIIESKISLKTLSENVGVAQGYFATAIREGMINPAVLFEVKKYVNIDIHRICPNLKYERVYNGRSTASGRMRANWKYIAELSKKEGYSTRRLSVLMGKSSSYLSSAKFVGGLPADMIIRLASILGVDPESLIDYVEPEIASIISMIHDQHYK